MSGSNIEPMQLDICMDDGSSGDGVDIVPNFSKNGHNTSYVVTNATLDLESYANSYTSFAKIQRLMFIADHCQALRVDALKMALNYVKEYTFNTCIYTKIYNKLSEALKSEGLFVDSTIGPIDQAWIEFKSRKGAIKLEKLDTDLKNYKSNSIKESIRRGHNDLGDHYLELGDMNNALKCYSRSRDYCTSGEHILNMCLNVIKVSIYTQNWTHVLTYVSKAEATPDYSPFSSLASKLNCAAGLAELASKKYKSAAKHFLSVNFDQFTLDFGDIISANNVAIYGGLCSLASFSRDELHKLLIPNSSFKLFLELEPQLRDAIYKFYDSKYANCLSILAEMKDNLLLDIYIAPHVFTLYDMIRNLALVQYFSPYLSADMVKMAAAFNTNITSLENELMQLILDGQIQARIDSHNKILFAKDVDQRTVTFEKAFKMGQEWQKRTKALILRSAMLRNGNIYVKSSPPNRVEEGTQINGQNGHQSTVTATVATK